MTKKANIIFLSGLFVILFNDAMSNGVFYTLLPYIFFIKRDVLIFSYKISTEMLYSFCLVGFSTGSLFGLPILTKFSQRIGKGRALKFGLIGILLSYLGAMIALLMHSYVLFLLSRIVGGFFAGSYIILYHVINATYAEINQRQHAYNILTIAAVTGVIFGPLIVSSISLFSGAYVVIYPLFIPILLIIMNLIMMKRILPMTETQNVSKLNRFVVTKSKNKFKKWSKKITLLMAMAIMVQLAIALYIQTLAPALQLYCHYGLTQISWFFVVMSIVLAVSTLLSMRLDFNQGNFKLYQIILLLSVMLAISIVSLKAWIGLLAALWFGALIFFAIFPNMQNAITAYITSQVSNQERIMASLGQITTGAYISTALIVGYYIKGHLIVIFMTIFMSMVGALFALSFV
ncbi:MFS transporter [Cysteiniphilum sp. 6C5]|uniref:MFS transporter n=1 Tax=unclassified Cysteiniphilum TaxID=2610889 RepID=UPI003F87B573